MMQAIITENVSLIKSIPQQYLSQVQTIVMQGVQNGRDAAYIADEIQERYKVSRNRAVVIARDQTNKATEAISYARCDEMGITHGFWMHRSGSKKPRITHVDFDGQHFELAKGALRPQAERVKGGGYRGKWVKPAQLINCNCTYKLDLTTIAPGLAMDGGKRRVLRLPAVTIEWGLAA